MQEYNLIETTSHELFYKTIDKALKDGWKLYGNLIVIPLVDSRESEAGRYIQAMIRDVKEKKTAHVSNSLLDKIAGNE